jgi:aminoglycoside phosphotransferase (APT) family kinase protein
MDWDPKQIWCPQIERRLYELGALAKGGVQIQADRIADVVEQIDTVRKDLEAVSTKLDKVADWVRANVPKKNGTEGKS